MYREDKKSQYLRSGDILITDLKFHIAASAGAEFSWVCCKLRGSISADHIPAIKSEIQQWLAHLEWDCCKSRLERRRSWKRKTSKAENTRQYTDTVRSRCAGNMFSHIPRRTVHQGRAVCLLRYWQRCANALFVFCQCRCNWPRRRIYDNYRSFIRSSTTYLWAGKWLNGPDFRVVEIFGPFETKAPQPREWPEMLCLETWSRSQGKFAAVSVLVLVSSSLVSVSCVWSRSRAVWSRSRVFGLGLGLGLEQFGLGLVCLVSVSVLVSSSLVSVSCVWSRSRAVWSRSRVFGLGLEQFGLGLVCLVSVSVSVSSSLVSVSSSLVSVSCVSVSVSLNSRLRPTQRPMPDHLQRPITSSFEHYKCTASTSKNSPPCPSPIPQAINDNGAAEGAKQVMERQRCYAKVSIFTGFVYARELSSFTASLLSDRTERRCRTVSWKALI